MEDEQKSPITVEKWPTFGVHSRKDAPPLATGAHSTTSRQTAGSTGRT